MCVHFQGAHFLFPVICCLLHRTTSFFHSERVEALSGELCRSRHEYGLFAVTADCNNGRKSLFVKKMAEMFGHFDEN